MSKRSGSSPSKVAYDITYVHVLVGALKAVSKQRKELFLNTMAFIITMFAEREVLMKVSVSIGCFPNCCNRACLS